MKNYKTLLILSVILLTFGCGELLDPYKDVIGNGTGTSSGGSGGGGSTASEWQTLSTGSNTISTTNSGYDALLVYAPADKKENVLYPTVNVTVSSGRGRAANSQDYNESNSVLSKTETLNALETATAEDFHTKLRVIENELLKSRAKQFIDDPLLNKSEIIAKKVYDKNTTYQFYNDTGGQFSVVCIDSSEHAYFFVPAVSVAQITPEMGTYKTGFEKIYSTVTNKFGPEGDVDDNGKILIIFYDMGASGTLGYFYSVDKYHRIPTDQYRKASNEADAFYVNSNANYVNDTTGILETLAHEFQHMTFFKNKYDANSDVGTDSWLNEGLSMLSSLYCDYAAEGSNNYGWISAFLSNKSNILQFPGYSYLSLTRWTQSNYGYSAIFSYYMNDVYGTDISKKIYDGYSSPTVLSGIEAIERATDEDFNDIFKNFAQALYLSNRKISSEKKFNFTSIDLTKFVETGKRSGLVYEASTAAGQSAPVKVFGYTFSPIHFSGATNEIAIPLPTDFYAYGAPLK